MSLFTAIVVTHNSAEALPGLFESLRRDCSVEIIVIDNASVDQTEEVVAATAPGAELVTLSENIGFGAAANLGISRAVADQALLVINPDISFSDGHLLAHLLSNLLKDPSAAAITPSLIDQMGSPVSTARLFPTRRDILARRVRDVVAAREDSPMKADWICGAFMLWRPGLLQTLGGFNEGYFLFFEDVDLCRRAAADGWHFLLDPGSVARHTVGHSHKHAAWVRKCNRRSRAQYASSHLGNLGAVSARIANCVEIGGSVSKGIRHAFAD